MADKKRPTGRGWWVILSIAFGFFIFWFLGRPTGPILDPELYSVSIYDRRLNILSLRLNKVDRYRQYRSLGEYPLSLVNATIMKEDQWFWWHPGFNPTSLFRAFWGHYISGESLGGASTIPMQLARLVYQLDTTDIPGKLTQIALAMRLCLYYSKEDILEAYLNAVPCGGNVEGFATASTLFLGKDLKDLDLANSLLLAVLPQSPERRNPRSGDQGGLIEARLRLYEQWRRRYPDGQDLTAFMLKTPDLGWHRPFQAPHYANTLVQGNPGRVSLYGTLDGTLQTRVEGVLDRYLTSRKTLGINNGAVLVLDRHGPEVLAWLGSANHADQEILGQNDGVRARRSPGSALKPFVYGLALEQGIITPRSVLKDSPAIFGDYTPENYGGTWAGPLSATDALVNSRNIPAINLARQLKPELWDLLARIPLEGLKSREHYGLSLTLGSAEMSLLELSSMYAALANGGIYRQARGLSGSSTASQNRGGVRILGEEAAWMVLNMLGENPRPGIVRGFDEINRSQIAYKTGTSIGFKDAWSVGIKGDLVVGVWIGNFDARGNRAFLGREAAAPLMFQVFDSLEDTALAQASPAAKPQGVIEVDVCSVSGAIPEEFCPHTRKTWFIPGVSPISRCKIHRQVPVDTITGFQVSRPGPTSELRVYEFWPSDLLSLFRQAGIERPGPPPLDQGITADGTVGTAGNEPEIFSPQGGIVYLMRYGEVEGAEIPCKANAAADGGELFWYVDQRFIGRGALDGLVMWRAEPGKHRILVQDAKGRSASVDISVDLIR